MPYYSQAELNGFIDAFYQDWDGLIPEVLRELALELTQRKLSMFQRLEEENELTRPDNPDYGRRGRRVFDRQNGIDIEQAEPLTWMSLVEYWERRPILGTERG